MSHPISSCGKIESWVLILPSEALVDNLSQLTEQWFQKYFSCLATIDIDKSSRLLASIHVLIPGRHDSLCLAVCRASYYLLMWLLRGRDRQCVHLACVPYSCDLEEIQRITSEEFLYTYPPSWVHLWSSNYQTRFVTLKFTQDEPEDTSTLNPSTRAMIHAVYESVRTLQRDYVIPKTVPSMLCFGGSFDGLHPGHLTTLVDLMTLAGGDGFNKLIAIAVSDDATVQSKDNTGLAIPFRVRRQQVMKCLSFLLHLMGFRKSLETRCERKLLSIDLAVTPRIKTALRIISAGWDTVIGLFVRGNCTVTIAITDLDSDGVGLAGEVGDLEAALVTTETLKGGHKLNTVRSSRGLPLLNLLVAPLMWPVEALLSEHAGIDDKISSRFQRAKLQHYWNLDSHCLDKSDLSMQVAVQRRQCFSQLCQEMGLTDAQVRVLLRCVVFPVHLNSFPPYSRSEWKVPRSAESVCSSQAEVESDLPDSGMRALRAANDFVALFLEDETAADSLVQSLHNSAAGNTSRGLSLLECIKGGEW
eukprot:Gregarina_sp_Poly_1__464@NODE_1110_length_5062_cov_263_885886_g769_i0_p2_GENE_NODE_1110_length_5062_cov_263_885886_g769_i0NODE_1110_length_5062_cov_263_885886_g769_i0_p2_ORF_typecomplete_len530_score67_04CTP_transf_like/PF01467_26/0_019_NODE_1110_length_5062_cov_263_885886_g769_i0691658